MKKQVKLFIGLGLITVILIVAIVVLLLKVKNKPSVEDRVSVFSGTCYTNDGILFNIDGLLRYTDTLSGKSIVLCDKPNCQHKYDRGKILEQTCNAVLEGWTPTLAIYKSRLYFAIIDEERITHIFEADTNGANRKEIAKLDNIQNITYSSFIDNYLLFAYTNSYDYQAESIAGVNLEKPIASIVAINLNTYEVTYLNPKESYGANTYKPYYYDNKIYYLYTYNDVKIDYTDIEYFIDNADYVKEHTFQVIYCYDLVTKKETSIYKGSEISIEDYYDNYAYIITNSNQLFQINLSDMTIRLLIEDAFGRCYVDVNQLIYTTKSVSGTGYIFKSYDLITEEEKEKGQSDIFRSLAFVCENIIYLNYYDQGEFCYGYISKKDFYDFNMDKVVPLVYPNLIGN